METTLHVEDACPTLQVGRFKLSGLCWVALLGMSSLCVVRYFWPVFSSTALAFDALAPIAHSPERTRAVTPSRLISGDHF